MLLNLLRFFFTFQPFPELPRIPGLVLDGSTFSDCLMVVQFLRNFGKVLGFDVTVDVPSLSVLQEGLLNIGDSMGEVQDLLVKLVSAAVCDPGLGTGYKVKRKKKEKIYIKHPVYMNTFFIMRLWHLYHMDFHSLS